jgi:flagellar biogenesis protein FliO
MPSITTLLGLMLAVTTAGPADTTSPAPPAALANGLPLLPPGGRMLPESAAGATGVSPVQSATGVSPVQGATGVSPVLVLGTGKMSVASTAQPAWGSMEIGSHANHNGRAKSVGPLTPTVTVVSSMAIVLGLFFMIAWGMRKVSPRGSVILPGEVFEILGRAPLSGRQHVQLLRCGSKLLLVSITPDGAETLTEVTEPTEVDRLAGLCRQAHPQSSTAAFRQVFQQFAPRSGEPRLDARELEQLDLKRSGRRGRRWEEDDA